MELIKDRSNRSQEVELIAIVSEKQMQTEIQKCFANKTSYTVASGKTALTGSCIPLQKGEKVFDVSFLHSLSREYSGYESYTQNGFQFCIDKNTHKAIFPCGIQIDELDDILERYNFFYPPTPGYKKCTLGGTVATNASGPRTFTFGPTRKSIFYLRIILPDGEVLEIMRGKNISYGEDFSIQTCSGKILTVPVPKYKWNNIKNVTGIYNALPLDIIDIFIGSEGIFGIISDIGINLQKIEEEIRSEIYFFDDQSKSIEAAFDAKKRKSDHISVELIDKNAIRLSGIEKYALYKGAVELEYYTSEKEKIDEWKNKFSVSYILSGKEVAPFRYGIPLNMSEILRKNNTVKLGTDFGVSDEIFPDILEYYFDVMSEFHVSCGSPKYITSAMWGHFGNSHLHINFLPNSEETQLLANKKYKEMAEYIVSKNGVIMAEHGVGKKQFYDGTDLLDAQDASMKAEIKKLKKVFDTELLLNRGNYGIV